MGKKGSMPSYGTIDDYIAHQPEETQKVLHELRSIINEAVPEAKEIPDNKVPSFTLVPGAKPKQQVMVAAYAKFVSFYPFPATIKHFSNELKGYEQGKGSVKFPLNKPLPKDLIMRMVKFRRDEVLQSLK